MTLPSPSSATLVLRKMSDCRSMLFLPVLDQKRKLRVPHVRANLHTADFYHAVRQKHGVLLIRCHVLRVAVAPRLQDARR